MDPHDAVYSAVEFGVGGGADTNGEYLFWGNATSSSAGTFGVGVLKIGLSDPIGELADWYNVSFKAALMLKCGSHYEETIVPSGDYLSVRFGVGYNSETLGYYEQMEPDYQPTSGSGGTHIHTCNPTGDWEFEHDLEERPFSLAEVQAMYMIIWLRFDSTAFALIPEPDTPKSLLLLYVQAYILPEEYTPPPESIPTPGSFILRPNGDLAAWAWSSTEATRTAAVNETYYHGDGDVSFINSTDTGAMTAFTLTDPLPWLAGEGRIWQCYPWVVAKTAEPIDPDEAGIWLGMRWTSELLHGLTQIAPLQAGWYNHSVGPMVVGEGPYINWTYDELVSAQVYLTSGLNNSITQIAVLCVLVGVGPTDKEMGGALEFFSNGGFNTIFGILGFLGLIAVPVVAAWSYREGNDGLGVAAGAIVLMVLFGGFFLVGLSGAWG
jgi:hypothetical protein